MKMRPTPSTRTMTRNTVLESAVSRVSSFLPGIGSSVPLDDPALAADKSLIASQFKYILGNDIFQCKIEFVDSMINLKTVTSHCPCLCISRLLPFSPFFLCCQYRDVVAWGAASTTYFYNPHTLYFICRYKRMWKLFFHSCVDNSDTMAVHTTHDSPSTSAARCVTQFWPQYCDNCDTQHSMKTPTY